jgi:predicted PurR-regulated permease PerM
MQRRCAMKKFLMTVFALAVLTLLPGCGNLSPRQEQEIDNQNGKIGEIENLANSIKAEVGNLKAQNDIQNSQLEKIQQGLVNMQSIHENSGVQILSGPGGLLFAIIALIVVTVLVLHYRSVAKVQQKTAEILAQSITARREPELEEQTC